MKNAEQQLAATLAENLHASIGGLNEKHTQKLLKKVAEAARMLARKHTKLLAKEQKKGKSAPRPLVAATAKPVKSRRVALPAAPAVSAQRTTRAAHHAGRPRCRHGRAAPDPARPQPAGRHAP